MSNKIQWTVMSRPGERQANMLTVGTADTKREAVAIVERSKKPGTPIGRFGHTYVITVD